MATLFVPNHTSTLEDVEALQKAVKGIVHHTQQKSYAYIKMKPENKKQLSSLNLDVNIKNDRDKVESLNGVMRKSYIRNKICKFIVFKILD